jgi:hypothetical protein
VGPVVALIAACGPGCVDTSEVAGVYPGIGSRVGVFSILGADDYRPGLTVGQYYAGTTAGVFGLRSLPFDVGLDVAYAKTEDDSSSYAVFQTYLDLLFSNWKNLSSGVDFYGLAGLRVLLLDSAGADPLREFSSSIDLGGGATSLSSRWDVRAVFSIVFGARDIGGVFTLTGGYRF